MLYPGSLHNHTDYSNIRLRDSVNKIESLIERAGSLGHEVLAITEHETIANAIKVEEAAAKYKEKYPNLKVLRGNEIYLCRNGLNASNFHAGDKYFHFILIAKDAIGHQQIRELSTRAWMRAYFHNRLWRVPTYYQDLSDIIGQNPGHIIGSTACLGGAFATQLLRAKEFGDEELYNKIKIWSNNLNGLFGQGNFFFEMQPSNQKEQIYVNKKILELSDELNIPYIITNDAHYLKREDLKIEETFLRTQDGEREVASFYGSTFLMSDEDVRGYMSYLTEEQLQLAYQNIITIKEMCSDFTLKKSLKIPTLPWRDYGEIKKEEYEYYLNVMPELAKFKGSPHYSDNKLVDAVIRGIQSHKDLQNDVAYDELNKCLQDTFVSSTVNQAEWSAYFLNLQRTIDICWEAGTIVGPGRGSGVGFLLLYCLDIIQINALREETQTFRFRFLNPDRVSVLDIDTDISGLHRGQVLDALRQFYGQDRVANVATFAVEQAKSAINSAARGLGIDVDIARYLSGMIESDRGIQRSLKQTFYGDEENGFAPNMLFRKEMTQNYPELWEVAQQIEGLIVRMGIHAGGVVFVDEPFTNSTALMRSPDGTIVTQFDLHDDEKAS